MKLKKGKGLRFGYYSNSPNVLDLLSFQTTLVIGAKINKMCCTAKENICFFPQFRSIIPCEVLLYIEVTFLGFIH